MKTVEVKLYEFSELSDKAKERAHEDYLGAGLDNFRSEEQNSSMKAFANTFPITVKDWNYGYGGTYINFSFDADETIEELSGWRLATYIWNNYRKHIYVGKYYSKSKMIDGEYTYKCRHSKIILQAQSCPFTGFCYDEDLLDPLWKFLKKPDSTTFEELMRDCLYSWLKSCESDYDYDQTMEAFEEFCEGNEWTFTEEGKRWR